jgi:hypothetical protein
VAVFSNCIQYRSPRYNGKCPPAALAKLKAVYKEHLKEILRNGKKEWKDGNVQTCKLKSQEIENKKKRNKDE